MDYKVSVIIPVYKVEKYLRRCLDSVVNQTLFDVEIILIDDGSPDGCPHIIDEYAQKDERVKVLHKQNEGLGMARNTGIEIATGEFLAFVDSDDFIAADMYEKLYKQAKENQVDVIFCGFYQEIQSNNFKKIIDFQTPILFQDADIQELALAFITKHNKFGKQISRTVWHAIYSKQLIVENHIKFPCENIIPSEDLIYHINVFQYAKKILFIPDAFYYYCCNEGSITQTFRIDRYERNKNERTAFLNVLKNDSRILIDLQFVEFTKNYLLSLVNCSSMNFKSKMRIIRTIKKDSIWKEIKIKFSFLSKKGKLFYLTIMLHSSILIYCCGLLSKRKNTI